MSNDQINCIILSSNGYLSPIVQKKLNEVGKKYAMHFENTGFGLGRVRELSERYDVILLDPSLNEYYVDCYKNLNKEKATLFQIKPNEYVVSNVDKMIKRLLDEIEIAD